MVVGDSVLGRPVPGVAAETGTDGPQHRHVGGGQLADDGLDPDAAGGQLGAAMITVTKASA
jgi:hypothetical protein